MLTPMGYAVSHCPITWPLSWNSVDTKLHHSIPHPLDPELKSNVKDCLLSLTPDVCINPALMHNLCVWWQAEVKPSRSMSQSLYLSDRWQLTLIPLMLSAVAISFPATISCLCFFLILKDNIIYTELTGSFPALKVDMTLLMYELNSMQRHEQKWNSCTHLNSWSWSWAVSVKKTHASPHHMFHTSNSRHREESSESLPLVLHIGWRPVSMSLWSSRSPGKKEASCFTQWLKSLSRTNPTVSPPQWLSTSPWLVSPDPYKPTPQSLRFRQFVASVPACMFPAS